MGFAEPTMGLLLRTDRPELVFVGIRQTNWADIQCYEALGVKLEDLAENVEIPGNRKPLSTEVPIDKLSLAIVKLLSRYATQLKVVYLQHQAHIHIPCGLCLPQEEWWVLSRHLFTGKAAGCVADTVPCNLLRDSHDEIKLPSRSLGEVMARWGISQQKPSGFDGDNLLFRSIHVDDALKLSCLFPATKRLAGRCLRLGDNRKRLPSYNLDHAIEAGVVPHQGDIIVDPKVKRIFLPLGRAQIASLKAPLEFRPESDGKRAGLLCPAPLVEHFLLSAAKAARTYRLPADLKKYEVRTVDPETHEESDLQGTYYLISNLTSLPPRDLRHERAERKARLDRLVARFGPGLPTDHEKYTDQQLSQYFTLKDLVARGEMIDVARHPALPDARYFHGDFFDWIKEVKPDLVMCCPVTQTQYLRSSTAIGNLADLPGFWKAVEKTLRQASWLRKLILDPKVRAAAMAHAI
jgi:hypothetical protein